MTNKNKFIPVNILKSPKSGRWRSKTKTENKKNNSVIQRIGKQMTNEFYNTIGRMNLLKNVYKK